MQAGANSPSPFPSPKATWHSKCRKGVLSLASRQCCSAYSNSRGFLMQHSEAQGGGGVGFGFFLFPVCICHRRSRRMQGAVQGRQLPPLKPGTFIQVMIKQALMDVCIWLQETASLFCAMEASFATDSSLSYLGLPSIKHHNICDQTG